jgi:F-type H+-transporting ATPase subunit alpha
MDIKSTDLIALFEKALLNQPEKKLDEIGFVIQVGDNLCNVHGLKNAIYGELIEFEGGNKGIIMNLLDDYVSIFLIDPQKPVKELEVAKRTKDVFKVPVGFNLLSRVINSLAEPVDGLGPIESSELRSIEVDIPSIVERTPIDRSLETGIIAIDALVPVGRGQRELIIGNRSTGKTSIAIDTILHQKGHNVYCVYVSIGQRQSNLARIVNILDINGALEYTTIVTANAGEPPLNQYLAPYVGTTIAEFYRDQNKDVLVVYDDLTNHAIAYREMSLLMRRAPGREAYPGDIFYLHSRLLERSGKLKDSGSITSLPIVQIQSDDITAYIPTNLISITDGQIFLDTKLFNNGIRPAVNVELSVSRVGGAAQTKAIKKISKSLRLELAQYNDLLNFAQFGTELDQASQKSLKRGQQTYELLKQKEFSTLSFVDQVLILFLLRENILDNIQLDMINRFANDFVSYIKSVYQDIYNSIKTSQDITENDIEKLKDIASDFIKMFVIEK